MLAALENGLIAEVDQTGNELITRLLQEPIRLEDGFLILPDAPGLGVSVSQEAIDAYALPDGAPIPFGNYADMAFGAPHYNAPKPAYA